MTGERAALEAAKAREKERLHRTLAEARRTVGPFDWKAWRQNRADLVERLRRHG